MTQKLRLINIREIFQNKNCNTFDINSWLAFIEMITLALSLILFN